MRQSYSTSGKQVSEAEITTAQIKGKNMKSKLKKASEGEVYFFISVGTEPFEGAKLKAQVACISDNCNDCIVILGDTLQAYNIMNDKTIIGEKCTLRAAKLLAKQKGIEWLLRNQNILKENLPAKYKIIHWNEVKKHSYFKQARQEIQSHLNTDASYRKALQVSVEEYMTRLQKRGKQINLQQQQIIAEIAENNKFYYIEECAGFRVMAVQGLVNGKPAKYGFYPNVAALFIKETLKWTKNESWEAKRTPLDNLRWVRMTIHEPRSKQQSREQREGLFDGKGQEHIIFFSDKKVVEKEKKPEQEIIDKIEEAKKLCEQLPEDKQREFKELIPFLNTILQRLKKDIPSHTALKCSG